MNRTPSSEMRHFVTLDKPKGEDVGETLTPSQVFCSIAPAPPSAFDENKITHYVRCHYHGDITLNTRIRTEDGRDLWVRGIENVEMRNVELRLLCEEVLTP